MKKSNVLLISYMIDLYKVVYKTITFFPHPPPPPWHLAVIGHVSLRLVLKYVFQKTKIPPQV